MTVRHFIHRHADLLDTMLALGGPAMALALVIVMVANAVGFALTAIVLLVQWLLG